jgi:hypothetical protein
MARKPQVALLRPTVEFTPYNVAPGCGACDPQLARPSETPHMSTYGCNASTKLYGGQGPLKTSLTDWFAGE